MTITRAARNPIAIGGLPVALLLLVLALALPGPAHGFQGTTLDAFESEADLASYLGAIREIREERLERVRREAEERQREIQEMREQFEAYWDEVERLEAAGLPPPEGPPPPPPPPPPPAPPPPPPPAPAAEMADSESITNNQTAGVDEGGIVKIRGDILVILRRGRLFTVSIADGGMRPIDMIDAYPPDTDGSQSWYDEMLIAGDRIVVIGYSYGRGGTEVNRFRLSEDGQLTFEDAHHLRSNDYYSVDNYASRLIGNRLIFYTPLNLLRGEDPLDALPGVKRWDGNPQNRVFERITSPNRVYATPAIRRSVSEVFSTLHSVTSCDVSSPDFDCTATGVIAGPSREFYVAGDAVYLWVSNADPYDRSGEPRYSHIYRLPLNEAAPSAIGARGAPINQFSFRADSDPDMLNVVVRAGGGSDAMWEPEAPTGTISLIRVPLSEFGDGSGEVRQRYYRHLERNESVYQFENRFVGDHLIYGHGRANAWRSPPDYSSEPLAYAVPLSGGSIAEFRLGHGVERIEPMGADAIVVGSNLENGLGFSAIELTGGLPNLGDAYVLPAAGQGESRSHAYFYRPDPGSPGGASGTLGLPIARQVQPEYRQLFGSAAAMLFLRRDDRQFSRAGELNAIVEDVINDGCRASCTDWYGNARPIFLRTRTFALLGYELVEGRMEDGRITEIGRLNYAPRSASAAAE
ncbi:MAG: beta-propeller domain-containing protein [Pseudomonadota bacterium]